MLNWRTAVRGTQTLRTRLGEWKFSYESTVHFLTQDKRWPTLHSRVQTFEKYLMKEKNSFAGERKRNEKMNGEKKKNRDKRKQFQSIQYNYFNYIFIF
jgi:hypothetical protein